MSLTVGAGVAAAGWAVAIESTIVLQAGGIGIVGIVLLAIAAFVLSSAVEIVDAYEERALTVLGEYRKILKPGINVVPPFVSSTTTYDMRTQTVEVPPQEAITQDNSPVTADAVIFIRVTDPEKTFLQVEDYKRAVSNLAQTTLRAAIGDMELDETLRERRAINKRIREEIAGPTDEWGVRVENVEVQEITPSRDVLDSMEQQTSAERRRRAMILEAQGERRSAIERAQGDKQSNIVRAQGEKQAQILEAQGDAISTVLRARSAEAMGERAVIDKGMETLASIGEGDSTTFVLPQELTSLVGRYGRHLSGSDVAGDSQTLEGGEFDADTREMLGLDDVDEIVEGLDAVGNGQQSVDDVVDEQSSSAHQTVSGDVDEQSSSASQTVSGDVEDEGWSREAESAVEETTDRTEAAVEEATTSDAPRGDRPGNDDRDDEDFEWEAPDEPETEREQN